MKQIQALYIPDINVQTGLTALSAFLDTQEYFKVEETPWGIQGRKPEVRFAIVHFETGIALKFYVEEQYTIARYQQSNDPVYKDSCVEFFIALGDEDVYYNFEFNSLGSCLMGFGPQSRANRIYQSPETIDQIKRSVSLQTTRPGSGVHWEITIMIPITVFCSHQLSSLSGRECRANFYKCGDELPQPHFLSWSNIRAQQPDFHQPAFFGKLSFLKS